MLPMQRCASGNVHFEIRQYMAKVEECFKAAQILRHAQYM